MRRRISGLLAMLLLLGPLSASATDGTQVQFDADYALYIKGAKVADMQRTLTHLHDGKFLFRSDTHPTGLISLFRNDHVIEQSTWEVDSGILKPLRYLYTRTGGGKERKVTVNFDWDKNRITNTVNGDSWKMPTQPDVMDKLLYQFAIMHDLEAGKRSLSYAIADGGKIKTYRFESRGQEKIDTPLGKLDTLKVVRYRRNSTRKTTLWCAIRLKYLPVKVVHVNSHGNRTVAVIQSLKGLRN